MDAGSEASLFFSKVTVAFRRSSGRSISASTASPTASV
jgi:hypothetical protein